MTQWSKNSSMSRGTSPLGTLMSSMILHSTTSIQPEQLTLPHPTKGPDWGNLGLEAEKGEGVYPSVDSTIQRKDATSLTADSNMSAEVVEQTTLNTAVHWVPSK